MPVNCDRVPRRRERVSVRNATKSKAARTERGTTTREVDPVPSGGDGEWEMGMSYNDLNVVGLQKWSLTLCAMLKKTLHITGWEMEMERGLLLGGFWLEWPDFESE